MLIPAKENRTMRSILTHIAIVSLLLHITLGCCSHHAHAESTIACNGHESMAEDGHQHDEEGEPCSSDQRENCPEDHCDELQCSFISVAKTSPTETVIFDIWLGLTGLWSEFLTVPTSHRAVEPEKYAPRPVREHVLLQVFLI